LDCNDVKLTQEICKYGACVAQDWLDPFNLKCAARVKHGHGFLDVSAKFRRLM
jgi:hypothetical protein